MSSRPRAGPGKAGLGRLDAAAGDAVRDDADEQLPVTGWPGLDARPFGRYALVLGHVVSRSLDQHAPALAAGRVDLVDLECHLVVAACDPGVQVLVERAMAGGPEHDGPGVPLLVHWQHGRAEPALVGGTADSARRNQAQAPGPVQLLAHAASHASTPASTA